MIYKERTKPNELLTMELLGRRMHLHHKDKQHLLNLQKGYEGEMLFDSLTKKLPSQCLILNDLLLQQNRTTFQIDTLIITQGKILLFEVKNFEGDYYYETGTFYKQPNQEITNPLHQMERSQSLLRQLILSLGFNPQIEGSVVFVNAKFMLYQAPRHQPIIYPTQITTHLSHLNAIESKLTDRHYKLADKLVALHISDSPFTKVPEYNFEEFKKGMICEVCRSLSLSVYGQKFICAKCGQIESAETAVIRSVAEFKALFPFEKITTTKIQEWNGGVCSKKRISTYLKRHYKRIGVRQWTYYE